MTGTWQESPTQWRTTPRPQGWKRLAAAVLERDGYACRIRGPRCVGLATEADHIGAADDHRLEMLQAACAPCHASKTGRHAAAARLSRRRERGRHPGLVEPPVGEGPQPDPRRPRHA